MQVMHHLERRELKTFDGCRAGSLDMVDIEWGGVEDKWRRLI